MKYNNNIPTPETHNIQGGGCTTCGVCHPNRCFECDSGGHKCHHSAAMLVPKRRFAYSHLGGIEATKNAEYTMSSMSNPNTERAAKRIDTQIPSLTDLGGVGIMKSFNPYNTLGTYNNNVNNMRNEKKLPKKFGGGFYTNVNLKQASGSPILPPRGIDMGGYMGNR